MATTSISLITFYLMVNQFATTFRYHVFKRMKEKIVIQSFINVKGYSMKQNPQGVFFTLSNPIIILFKSPARANNS